MSNKSDSSSHNLHSRREFLEFLGKSAAAASLLTLSPLLNSCSTFETQRHTARALPFTPIAPSKEDQLKLANGFTFKRLLSWGDPINQTESFGTNNDYLAFFPLNTEGTDGILWVNHEGLLPLFISGAHRGISRTKEQVVKEQASVGGSLVRIKKDPVSGEWSFVQNDPYNRRLSAQTPIPIISERPIQGSKTAIGTFANCAGGVTPWGTVLTCEENYQHFYGEAVYDKNGKRQIEPSKLGWEKFFNYPPEHYGWVVEVNPLTGDAKKLTSLGRFCHECATVRPASDGRVAVYTGDDGADLCLYKFISAKPGSLESGTLYVANLDEGSWIPLDFKTQKILQKNFKDQTDVLIRAREAAQLLGGTPLARPEDIEIDPVSGAVFVALTNNYSRDDYFGSILKIEEDQNDPLALKFKSSVFLTGGAESGMACPDNMIFDCKGNMWLTSDISGSLMNKPPYEKFQNNGLFYIPLSGENAGQIFQVASAPIDAELTGPWFSPDGKTLFLAVQHPGELSKSLDQLTSHWPDGGNAIPKSSVVAISGPALDRLMSGPKIGPVFEIPVLKG